MQTDMNWELAEFSLDPHDGSARYTFTHDGGSGREPPEPLAIRGRLPDQQGQSDEHLRQLANQRLIQVLNEIELALVG